MPASWHWQRRLFVVHQRIFFNALFLRRLELTAKENKLSVIFEQGYWILIGILPEQQNK
jgi:hypothetical protein